MANSRNLHKIASGSTYKIFIMKLELTAELTIRELNRIFQLGYPYLKLEFFRSPVSTKVNEQLMLIDINGILKEGELEIFDDETAADLEQALLEKFDLVGRVYRRENHSWVAVEFANLLTLEKQNAIGAASYQLAPEYTIL